MVTPMPTSVSRAITASSRTAEFTPKKQYSSIVQQPQMTTWDVIMTWSLIVV
jgi:hypothetical protein